MIVDSPLASRFTQVHEDCAADRANLLGFVRGIRRGPERVVLVHGEAKARKALAEGICAAGLAERVEG